MSNKQHDRIEHFSRGGEQLSLSIRGLTREDLLQAPAADQPELGLWTIQQVVLHLMDCEGVYADRIKRIIAEENPILQGFDENKWAKGLGYDEQSADDACKLVDLTRRQLGKILAKLPDSAWTRAGMHSEAGRQTLLDIVTKANNHLEHHLKFIHAKRAAVGKEMW